MRDIPRRSHYERPRRSFRSLEKSASKKIWSCKKKTAEFTRQQAALGSRSAIDLEAGLLLSEGGAAVKTNAPVGAADIQRLEHEIQVLESADKEQQKIVDCARSDFSVLVCDAQRADYIRIQKDILAALEKLAQANH